MSKISTKKMDLPFKMKSMNNADRLLNEAAQLLAELDLVEVERYEKNIKAFLKECPDDGILAESHISWDGEVREFDILWDTSNLDMRFSIGIDKARWQIWSGVNHHSKDDETFSNGVGGCDINDEEPFAYWFFDNLESYWKYYKEYWSPYQK